MDTQKYPESRFIHLNSEKVAYFCRPFLEDTKPVEIEQINSLFCIVWNQNSYRANIAGVYGRDVENQELFGKDIEKCRYAGFILTWIEMIQLAVVRSNDTGVISLTHLGNLISNLLFSSPASDSETVEIIVRKYRKVFDIMKELNWTFQIIEKPY